MERNKRTNSFQKKIILSAAEKIFAFILASAMVFVSSGDVFAYEMIFPAVTENIISSEFRLEGGRIIARQKGFCVSIIDTESGRKTEINLAHKKGEAPGECIISSGGIFMKSKDMTIEKIGGEWRLFGGKIYDLSGNPVHDIPKKKNESRRAISLSLEKLPAEEEKIEELRVRWLGEKTLAITNGERLFYYNIESGNLTEKEPANRKTVNL